MPFVKLDCGIVDSSMWTQPLAVRVLWITILTLTDPVDGICRMRAPGLARRAAIPLAQCRKALKVLESPDADDRSGQEQGRRIVPVDGGYRVVNFRRYRERDYTAADRMKRMRQRRKAEPSAEVPAAPAEPEVPGSEPYLWARYCRLVADHPAWERRQLRDALARVVAPAAIEAAMAEGRKMRDVIELAEHPDGRPSHFKTPGRKGIPAPSPENRATAEVIEQWVNSDVKSKPSPPASKP